MYDCENAEMLGPVQKDMAGRAGWSLVILSSKTYVFENKLSISRFGWSSLSVCTPDAGQGNAFHMPCIPSTATVQHWS